MFESLQLLKHAYGTSMMQVKEEPACGNEFDDWLSDSETSEQDFE
jgi:hypothetical protein